MSFVRQADPSASCAESPYIHKFGPPGSVFPAQFASGTELLHHGPQPYNAEGYRQSGFNGTAAHAFQSSFYLPWYGPNQNPVPGWTYYEIDRFYITDYLHAGKC